MSLGNKRKLLAVLSLVPTLPHLNAFLSVFHPGIFIISADKYHIRFATPLIPIAMRD